MSREPIIVDGVDVNECEWIREVGLDSEYICTCNSPNKTSGYCKYNPNCCYKQLKRKEQECEELKERLKEMNEVIRTETTRCSLVNSLKSELDQLKAENDSIKSELMQTNCYLDADKETIDKLKAKNETLFKAIEEVNKINKRLEAENIELRELVKTRIEDLCDSCGASSMIPMPCKVYEQALQEVKNLASCGKDMYMERGKYENYEAMAEWMKNQFYFILQKCEVLKDE